jgi:hypothetical protein
MKLSDDLIALVDKTGMSRASRAEKRALEIKPHLADIFVSSVQSLS